MQPINTLASRDSTVPLSKGQIFASRYCNISGLLLANRVHLV